MANYGNKFRKVQSGERRVLPADLWNAVLETVEYVQGLRDRGGALTGVSHCRVCMVPVKNTTAEDRSRWDVLGLGDVLYTPSDAEDEFRNQPILKGETPALASHLGKFCVLAEPIEPQGVGWAVVGGVVPVKLTEGSGEEWYRFADIDAGIATSLKRRPYGAAQVLWRAAGGDEQWAVVRLGNPAGQTEFYGTLTAELVYRGYADATLSYAGETHTQRVHDLLLASGGSLAAGTKIVARYWADEQKFYVTGATC